MPEATGGSSGVPTRFFITIESYDWRTAVTQRAYAWSGSLLGERMLYLSGAPLRPETAWQANKDRLYHWLRRELPVNTFRQTAQFWDDTWRRAAAFRPSFIAGYVSSLESFVRYGQMHEMKLPGLRAVLAMAEPVYDSLRTIVRETLNVPLFNTYGSREFMSIAAECDVHQGLHVNAENILLETKEPASGGPSEFLVTDLHNLGMPFIRYEIGDIGIMDSKSCRVAVDFRKFIRSKVARSTYSAAPTGGSFQESFSRTYSRILVRSPSSRLSKRALITLCYRWSLTADCPMKVKPC